MPDLMVYLQGEILPLARARISVRDRSFRHGEGVFETLRARGRRAFRCGGHLERLWSSAEALGWRLPWDETSLAGAVEATLEANRLPESRVRIHASPGSGGLDRPEGPPVLLVEAEPFVPVAGDLRRAGVGLSVWDGRRSRRRGLAAAKTASYGENLLARRRAREAGAHDALILDEDDHVCEASCANLFAVRAGCLLTPPLECGVLAGITRRVVLDLAGCSTAREVREEPLTLEDLRASEELFLTSTGVELLPVTSLNGREAGGGAPGPLTGELSALYRGLLDHELGPLPH
jgi:branched-subunit amino acid aminotransferase/4-amino-4-deoxychorismate lyase